MSRYTVIAKTCDSAAEHTDRVTIAAGLSYSEAEAMVDALDDAYPHGVYAIDEESHGVVLGRTS